MLNALIERSRQSQSAIFPLRARMAAPGGFSVPMGCIGEIPPHAFAAREQFAEAKAGLGRASFRGQTPKPKSLVEPPLDSRVFALAHETLPAQGRRETADRAERRSHRQTHGSRIEELIEDTSPPSI